MQERKDQYLFFITVHFPPSFLSEEPGLVTSFLRLVGKAHSIIAGERSQQKRAPCGSSKCINFRYPTFISRIPSKDHSLILRSFFCLLIYSDIYNKREVSTGTQASLMFLYSLTLTLPFLHSQPVLKFVWFMLNSILRELVKKSINDFFNLCNLAYVKR